LIFRCQPASICPSGLGICRVAVSKTAWRPAANLVRRSPRNLLGLSDAVDLALSSLTHEDAQAFAKFLAAPPRSWIGSVDKRDAPTWRPFRETSERASQSRSGETLDARSIRHAVTILSGMFAWMVEKGYLTANPFVGVRTKHDKEKAAQPIDWADERSFTQVEWNEVLRFATAYRRGARLSESHWVRLRFLLEFLHATGLRLSEIVRARMKDLYTDDQGWHWLRVQGKGQKIGKVAVPPSAYRVLNRYLDHRGLNNREKLSHGSEPLLASVQTNRMSEGIRTTQTAGLLRSFFRFAATQAADRKLKDKLSRASTHWMRHTSCP
jgi:site-specific recombinase XerC